MNVRYCAYLIIAAISTTANADIQKFGEAYAGIADNAILAVLACQLFAFVWSMGSWIVNKYFKEQTDKDEEVKKLKSEFQDFRQEMSGTMREIKVKMDYMAKLPDEEAILKRIEHRMEVMVFRAAKDLGIKDKR